jgi:hypothetical protein
MGVGPPCCRHRTASRRSEIVTLSWWTSLDAIRAFAGEPPDRARYFPEDSEYLLTRPDYVRHYRSSDIG